MSSAKAASESDTHVLAFGSGRKHGIRVNAISADTTIGPIVCAKATCIFLNNYLELRNVSSHGCINHNNLDLAELVRKRLLESKRDYDGRFVCLSNVYATIKRLSMHHACQRDPQPWLEFDGEYDFMSVNGDFTPSRAFTVVQAASLSHRTLYRK